MYLFFMFGQSYLFILLQSFKRIVWVFKSFYPYCVGKIFMAVSV